MLPHGLDAREAQARFVLAGPLRRMRFLKERYGDLLAEYELGNCCEPDALLGGEAGPYIDKGSFVRNNDAWQQQQREGRAESIRIRNGTVERARYISDIA